MTSEDLWLVLLLVEPILGSETEPKSLKRKKLERVKGFEPSTSTLARSHSTTELHPRLPGRGCH